MSTPSQVQEYEQRGFLAIPDVLPISIIEQLRTVVDEYVELSRAINENDSVFDLEPTHSPKQPQLRRLKQPASVNKEFNRAMRSDAILDIVEPLLGTHGVRYQADKLNMKIAEVGSPVEWHQDVAFYPHTNDDLLAVGVALDDCTLENGCLMCIPGSHKEPILDHHANGYFAGAVSVTNPGLALDKAVPLEVSAGSVTVHHVRTLHGSSPNTSQNPRRLWLISYMAADAWPLQGVKDYDQFTKSLLRGDESVRIRVTDHDVRMPLPPSPTGMGSIYEVQGQARETVYR